MEIKDNNIVPVVDFANCFKDKEIDNYYTEDLYGGHFSPEGNYIIAKYIGQELQNLGYDDVFIK